MLSEYFPKKKKNLKLFWQQIKKKFIKKSAEKSELLVQIAKVSGRKIETTDQRIHNFQLTKIGEKKEGENDNYQILILSAYEANKTLKTIQK